MPFALQKRGDVWKVVNTDTGQVKGTHESKIKGQRQLNLLRGIKHGFKPTGRPARK
ncbi:hypothetical protein LCGC14_0310580 [marine sediment metagenome]|uniref:Uncharacterized protein n=1 Tax=marine sediment metagenome TaxID=412755 RepID=A0A0F9TM55_9ZZZZ